MEFKLIDWLKSLNILQQLFFYRQFTKLDGSKLHIFTKTESEDNLSKLSRRGGGGGERDSGTNRVKKKKNRLSKLVKSPQLKTVLSV